jgi:methylenetetrahydrofolate reductase (NADPH)
MHKDLAGFLRDDSTFIITVEIIPTRGAITKDIDELMQFAKDCISDGRVHALSLTDNPGGNPRLSPDILGLDIREQGLDVIVHLACKDYNRNGIESRAYQLSRLGLDNILALSGDYPVEGYRGLPRPGFDIDSVMLLKMLGEMNDGLKVAGRKPGTWDALDPTRFLAGACVSPFKWTEAELMNQYYKLVLKIRTGAQFIITQVGYDARKFDELLRFMRHNNLHVPVLGNVYVLTRAVGRVMHRGELPGCVVTDAFLDQLNRNAELPDKGKQARLELAAKQIAVLKGLGYRGAHIGGYGLKFEHLTTILDLADRYFANWQEHVKDVSFGIPGGYYLYQKDEATGLNTDALAPAPRTRRPPLSYTLMKRIHDAYFEPGTLGFRWGQRICGYVDERPSLTKCLYSFERAAKNLTSRCRECGDCALPEMAFLCPESQCAKFMRNGQCGGSRDGMCEVWPDRRCVWVRIYERLKSHGAHLDIRDREPVARDWHLDRTSSWINFYLGRDHAHIKPPPAKEASQEKE